MGAPYLTADELSAMQGLPALDAQQAALQRQAELAQLLMMGGPRRQYSTGLGALFGGLGDTASGLAGTWSQLGANKKMDALVKQRGAGEAAGAKLKALMGVKQLSAADQDLAAGAQRMGLEKQEGEAKAASRARLLDPASPRATMGAEFLRRMGLQVPEGATAEDIEAQVPSATRLEISKQAARDRALQRELTTTQRKDAAALAAQKRAADTEEGLRKEFTGNKLVKDTLEVATSYEKVKLAAADPSGASDMTLIFGLMKILDPGSTVREGEYATAQNTGSIPERVVGAYNRALNGQKLDEAVRQDFVKAAGKAYQGQLQQFKKFEGSYRNLAEGSGADPSRVAIDLGLGAPTPAAGAPTGGLTPEEAEELKALKARFGGGR